MRFVGSGTLAGVLSTLIFTVVHQLLISSIWFALLPMLVAGALCGLCLAWSYAIVIPTATLRSWLLYNLVYLAMFVALGITSLLTFEPETTIAALLAANQPPNQLIGRALPMTAAFCLTTAALLSVLYRVNWRGGGGIVLTVTTLVLLLGLNISTLGLVEVPRDSLGVLLEVFGLLLSIFGVYAAVVVLLERSRFDARKEPLGERYPTLETQ